MNDSKTSNNNNNLHEPAPYLSKRKLDELVKQVDPTQTLDSAVEQVHIQRESPSKDSSTDLFEREEEEYLQDNIVHFYYDNINPYSVYWKLLMILFKMFQVFQQN